MHGKIISTERWCIWGNSNITVYLIILIMKKIAYLLGNGATMAELESKDHENRLYMNRIAEEVAEEAVKNDSSSHLSELLIKADTMHEIDVEELISIYIYNDKNIGDDYKDIPKKLQTYFRNVVIGILKDDEGYKNQNLSKCLLRLHKKYNEYMSVSCIVSAFINNSDKCDDESFFTASSATSSAILFIYNLFS